MNDVRVFVNYRRKDAPGSAGRLHDDLADRFGEETLFRDVQMRPGIDFVDEITKAAGSCHVLLAVIGPRWAEIADADGRPRIMDPGDYVRLEIETAIARPDVVVVPVLVEDATMPTAAQLPASLHELTRLNACRLGDPSWDYDVQRLGDALAPVLGTAQLPDARAPDAGPRAELHRRPRRRGRAGAARHRPGRHGAGGGAARPPDRPAAQARSATSSRRASASSSTRSSAASRGPWSAPRCSRRGWSSPAPSARSWAPRSRGACAGFIGGFIGGVLFQGSKYLNNPSLSTTLEVPSGVTARCAGYAVAAGLIGWTLAGATRKLYPPRRAGRRGGVRRGRRPHHRGHLGQLAVARPRRRGADRRDGARDRGPLGGEGARAGTASTSRWPAAPKPAEADTLGGVSSARAPRVVVVSGHMVDSPGRPRPRFPPDQVARVDAEVREALEKWGVDGSTTLVTGGARGADLLAAEAARERGAKVRLVLALPPDEFESRSVALDGTDWARRFRSALAEADEVEVVEHPPDADVFARTNTRMIEVARELDPEPHALLVWNGQEGDGPGGTRDFIAQLGGAGPGDRVRIIDPTPPA